MLLMCHPVLSDYCAPVCVSVLTDSCEADSLASDLQSSRNARIVSKGAV